MAHRPPHTPEMTDDGAAIVGLVVAAASGVVIGAAVATALVLLLAC